MSNAILELAFNSLSGDKESLEFLNDIFEENNLGRIDNSIYVFRIYSVHWNDGSYDTYYTYSFYTYSLSYEYLFSNEEILRKNIVKFIDKFIKQGLLFHNASNYNDYNYFKNLDYNNIPVNALIELFNGRFYKDRKIDFEKIEINKEYV